MIAQNACSREASSSTLATNAQPSDAVQQQILEMLRSISKDIVQLKLVVETVAQNQANSTDRLAHIDDLLRIKQQRSARQTVHPQGSMVSLCVATAFALLLSAKCRRYLQRMPLGAIFLSQVCAGTALVYWNVASVLGLLQTGSPRDAPVARRRLALLVLLLSSSCLPLKGLAHLLSLRPKRTLQISR